MSALLVIMAVRVTAGRVALTAAVQWNTMDTTARKVRRIYYVSVSPLTDPVHTTPGKFANAALFPRLDLPFTSIRSENRASRKRWHPG